MTVSSKDWAIGYARQAQADYSTFELLQVQQVPECHKLQFLQMACEKLVKAHLCGSETPLEKLQKSHSYVAANLALVLREQPSLARRPRQAVRSLLENVKKLAREINLLSPSVDDNGKRPANCEYPWVDESGTLHSPLDWTFPPSDLLVQPSGRAVLKLIRGAIERAAQST